MLNVLQVTLWNSSVTCNHRKRALRSVVLNRWSDAWMKIYSSVQKLLLLFKCMHGATLLMLWALRSCVVYVRRRHKICIAFLSPTDLLALDNLCSAIMSTCRIRAMREVVRCWETRIFLHHRSRLFFGAIWIEKVHAGVIALSLCEIRIDIFRGSLIYSKLGLLLLIYSLLLFSMCHCCTPILSALNAILCPCLTLTLISLMSGLRRAGVFLIIALGPNMTVKHRIGLLGGLSLW